MFQFTHTDFQLDLYHQRAAEWHRAAAADRLASEAVAGRPHRDAWWHRRPRQVRAPATS